MFQKHLQVLLFHFGDFSAYQEQSKMQYKGV